MKNLPEPPDASRRQFVRQIARGAALVGAGAVVRPAALAADANPFAYDVSRFARTDPKLIGWEEVARFKCEAKDARRLAIGPGDVMHVAAGNQILRRGPEGSLPALEMGASVTCVAVAADGALYAGLRDRIAAFDPAGVRVGTWAAPDPKSWFTGLAVSAGDVWVADSGRRIVWRFDRAGKLLGRLGARQPDRNIPGFIVPSPFLDVRLHPDGLLRINNPGRHRVEAYTVEGDFEIAWGQPSAGITGFCGCCNPIGLAILPDGRAVTAEKGLPRVKVYRADGTLESVVAGTESFKENHRQCSNPNDCTRGGLDVAVDGRGRICILDRVTGEVRTLQPKARA